MEKRMIDISDEKIRLRTLCKEDEETYLYLRRHASLVAPLYEKNKDLWEYMMPDLKEKLEADESRCLIYEIGNSDAVGFIEASTNMDNHKEIKKKYDSKDMYDVQDYDDPEDFYYDHVDEFDDVQDAEDYWEEAQQ